ncbi:MAG: hypothetical protein M1818_002376 [Claussenomyces sp. TS43310]|nr:MAG: hypothetical protein M1818_002376 [Claussenomyces sp. TS43310]
MAPTTTDEHFKFLISCIRYSNNGKVDFGEVAKECKIVSKGAAAKRYERMMKAHGIAPGAAAIKPGATPRGSAKTDRVNGSGTPLKKRKMDDFTDDAAQEDDPESFGTPPLGQSNFGTLSVKSDPDAAKPFVKEEQGSQLFGEDNAMTFQQHMNLPINGPNYMPFNTSDGAYASGSSDIYDATTAPFSTPSDHGGYGLARSYMDFTNFGSSQPHTPASQIGSTHDETVFISD